jgi:hypothetical protein
VVGEMELTDGRLESSGFPVIVQTSGGCPAAAVSVRGLVAKP